MAQVGRNDTTRRKRPIGHARNIVAIFPEMYRDKVGTKESRLAIDGNIMAGKQVLAGLEAREVPDMTLSDSERTHSRRVIWSHDPRF
jgi:hypothetical protein